MSKWALQVRCRSCCVIYAARPLRLDAELPLIEDVNRESVAVVYHECPVCFALDAAEFGNS